MASGGGAGRFSIYKYINWAIKVQSSLLSEYQMLERPYSQRVWYVSLLNGVCLTYKSYWYQSAQQISVIKLIIIRHVMQYTLYAVL